MDSSTTRFRKSPRIDPSRISDPSAEIQLPPSSEKLHLEKPESEKGSGDKKMTSASPSKTSASKLPARPTVVESAWRVLKTTLGCSYTTYLLPFVFLGIYAGHHDWDDSIAFLLNFLAIIPLASLLSFATEELAKSVGQTIGGLINATFGNAIEMIVCSSGLSSGHMPFDR